MKYKINLHAHSTFSDGSNTPAEMAHEAKDMGFSALVLTDHYYNGMYPDNAITLDDEEDYFVAIEEARKILPVIRGMEALFGGEEILVFGQKAIQTILKWGVISNIYQLRWIKEHCRCAFILAHPNVWHDHFAEVLDGYERHNSGQDFFKFGEDEDRPLGVLEGLQEWHNSDAHSAMGLVKGYNLLDVEITNEIELIEYIKSGKKHGYNVMGEDFEC